jgi:hypothetical protein
MPDSGSNRIVGRPGRQLDATDREDSDLADLDARGVKSRCEGLISQRRTAAFISAGAAFLERRAEVK